jgi:hypothetical protein
MFRNNLILILIFAGISSIIIKITITFTHGRLTLHKGIITTFPICLDFTPCIPTYRPSLHHVHVDPDIIYRHATY